MTLRNRIPSLPLPARGRLGGGLLAILTIVCAAVIAAGTADAQPITPRDGGPFPSWIQRVLDRDPAAFTHGHAWIRQVETLRENRRAIEAGERDVSGLTADQLRSLTVVSGTREVPVLLGRFSDTPSDPFPHGDLQTELFDGPWATGTMGDYYREVSYGNLQVQGTVQDWVGVSGTGDYYAGACSGSDPAFAHTGEFITEVLTANDAAVDFGQYDNDGPDGVPNSGDDDGFVDFVAIVHSESGAECDNSPTHLWAHRWRLSAWPEGAFTTNDARAGGAHIQVDDYTLTPAYSCDGGMIEIGVYCHEFGHAFGVPDLYDTDTSGGSDCLNDYSSGVGWWCLMGSGNWNSPSRPAHMSAWIKSRLGWLTPGTVTTNLMNWIIQPSTTTPTAFKLWNGGAPGSEYFLVEYRTRSGFDDQIAAPGVLIWHVDESIDDNKDECHKLVDLECEDQDGTDHTLNADGIDHGMNHGGNRGDAGDPFCDGDAFGTATNPSDRAYNGVLTSVQVTGITGCGGTLRANLIVGYDSQDVNLCIKDCSTDACAEPSPCPVFWDSPDIYIDNNDDGIIDPPAEGIANRLYARIGNVGTQDAADVDVRFYYTDPALGQLFPSTGHLIDTGNIPLIDNGGAEAVAVDWTIPVPPPVIDHYCIGVIAQNEQDGAVQEFAPDEDNLAQINMQRLYRKAGTAVPPPGKSGEPPVAGVEGPPGQPEIFETVQRVILCNPFNYPCSFTVRIGSPPEYDDAVIPPDWTVELQFTQIYLVPRQCAPLLIRVKDNNPVHGDQARVPITLTCGNQAVAGGEIFVFTIDNVQPLSPCGFQVIRELPPGGDDNPGEGGVEITWQDSFVDVLGFPERVERWRIYRGATQSFLPGTGNLIAETCLDEKSGDTKYTHFADVPPDPALQWYKLVAVDRAGNCSDTCVTRIQYRAADAPPEQVMPASLEILPNRPNPFAGSTEIVYTLPQSGEARVEIFSIDGRRVRSLAWGLQDAGEHRLVWDGRDAGGARVAGGLYYCRLTQGGIQRSRTLLLLAR